MNRHRRRVWVRLLAARGLFPGRIAFVLDVNEDIVVADLAIKKGPIPAKPATPPLNGSSRAQPKRRLIYGQAGTRVRRLASLGYDAQWIAATLALKPAVVADFLRRLEPVRKTELVRPRERSEEKCVRANQAAAAAREERRRILTPPAGWSNGDRFTTGEARDWARFTTALQEARLSGADILGLASRVWFAPPRSRPQSPPVEPAIWTGTENPYAGNPKLTREMLEEMRVLRAHGWSTGKLAKRYGVKRATICYALLGRTFRELPPPSRPIADAPAKPAAPPHAHAHEETQIVVARTPGWSNADRFATGESKEWAQFRVTAAQAHASGAELLCLPAPTLPEPAIWTGPAEFEWEQEFD